MSYYNSNAIYNSLQNNPNYCWTVGNAWILVYGDSGSEPKLMVFAQGASWRRDNRVLNYVTTLASLASLPLMHIEFDDSAQVIETVRLHSTTQPSRDISLQTLKETFEQHGVPVNNDQFAKAINDKESSAYHKWQRASLGRITVSDIDLIRLDNQSITAILELKRSYYGFERWKPFPADFSNFRLLNKVCVRAGIAFTIAYNIRHKSPRVFDDPSQIKLFFYDAGFNPTHEKIVPLADFVSLNY